ncbi:MAG: carbohydrate kinase family protein [Clostridia bacterium]|nr:carbohydrate kinase family protein [Clostridia bacterium]
MKGIAVAGSILIDRINDIEKYPEAGELTKILAIKSATGGCVPNVAIDLKRLMPELDVLAIGKVGKDADGILAKDILSAEGVDVSGITEGDERTSFTEVMSEVGGQRTFFTYPGASDDFGYSDIDFESLDCKMLHLGYYLLLKKVDGGDGELILKEAKRRGITTSIDLVSENSDRYSVIIPSLKYTDNLIINELEAGKLTGIDPSDDNLEAIAKRLMELGVRERVIIHKKELGILLSERGLTVIGSYELPGGFIKGTTGAGDAFCAGALLGIYENKSDREILELATLSALGALSAPDAVSGMSTVEELQKLTKGLGRKEICL